MKTFNLLLTFSCFLLFLFTVSTSGTCIDPEIISTSYTTEDSTILTHIAYISEFTVKCNAGAVTNLYALMGDSIQPVGITGPNKYQISWTEDIKIARTGEIAIKLYDDDGFTIFRKTQRAGGNLEDVAVFANIIVNHPGTYKGPWISCECLAVAFSIVVCYYAIQFRAKLLS